MSVGMGAGAGLVDTGMGGSSELMGVLGDTYVVYNLFPGPYHPDYLWVPPSMTGVSSSTNKVLLFSGVNSIDGEAGSNMSSPSTSPHTNNASNIPNNHANTTMNTNLNYSTTGHTAKRCRMSTDNMSDPPSSAVSYSSCGGDSFMGYGVTSAGNSNNMFWHHSSNGGGADLWRKGATGMLRVVDITAHQRYEYWFREVKHNHDSLYSPSDSMDTQEPPVIRSRLLRPKAEPEPEVEADINFTPTPALKADRGDDGTPINIHDDDPQRMAYGTLVPMVNMDAVNDMFEQGLCRMRESIVRLM
ncbi:hypothetical protein BD769DRAFT_1663135 [Suillus cothurnatus]|nr:hypothetical protein BD769DRAFT_1663135 [Suillus cothurnatus]